VKISKLVKVLAAFVMVTSYFNFPVQGQKKNDGNLLETLMAKQPAFDSLLLRKEELNIQVIYTQIDRDKKGKIKFTDHFFNTDAGRYFYPASTVKLPVAILALQRLKELGIPGLDKNTTMITGQAGDRLTAVMNDPTAPDGRPTIAHYIKKILLVSDNDAFNRLYEFLGQEYINNSLHEMGYTQVQIIHRLDIFLSEAENRLSNPVTFLDASGRVVYHQPARTSTLEYIPRDSRLGKGFMRGGQLVEEPFDFSKKNLLPLDVLHNIIKSIMFPGEVKDKHRFNISEDDYAFLRKYMSMIPPESKSPAYDTTEYHSNYVKFLYYGGGRQSPDPSIRIFNKPGDAYGFMIDGIYFADFGKKIEFLLSAAIHSNSDGIFNDNKYEYDSITLPFLKNLGRLIYEYEMQRTRLYPPDLSGFRFVYKE
jgi:hypothetical protein